MRFYVGMVAKIAAQVRSDVPVFISLGNDKTIERGVINGPWAIDSGSYTFMRKFGGELLPHGEYLDLVRGLIAYQYPLPDFVSCQDWLCLPSVLEMTGKTVDEHQALTCQSYLRLMSDEPGVRWLPILQGQTSDDYRRHLCLYRSSGVTTSHFGIGSIASRQVNGDIQLLIKQLHAMGLSLHAFGFNKRGLPTVSPYLDSADSYGWSKTSVWKWRRGWRDPLCSHVFSSGKYKGEPSSCANCVRFAVRWYDEIKRLTTKRTHQVELLV